MSIENSLSGVSGAPAVPAARPVPSQPTPQGQAGAMAGRSAGIQAESSSMKLAEQVLRKPDVGYSADEVRRNLSEAIDRLNDQMRQNGRDLAFQIDDRVDRTVITVRQTETGEVVRQIPSEDVLKLAHSIEDIKGLLFNEVT